MSVVLIPTPNGPFNSFSLICKSLGLLVLDGGVDNDVLTRDPVDRGGDAVLVTGLEGVDDAEDLGGVAAGGGRVGEDGADGLLGVDDEDGSDGEGNALLIDVEKRNLALLVTNDGELDVAASNLTNVLDPSLVGLDGVGGETDELDVALGELWLELGKGTELSGADGGVVLGVGEEDDPVVADELVEVNVSLCGLGLEIGGGRAQTKRSRSRHFVCVE
ncbi:hypothetical protein HG531_004509 [Fusarium graminearum]|nr:hypothetical protein HG531_004509 [Fusarium graminearum]